MKLATLVLASPQAPPHACSRTRRQSRETLSTPGQEPHPSPNTRSRGTAVACSPAGPSIRVRSLNLGGPEPPATELRPKAAEKLKAILMETAAEAAEDKAAEEKAKATSTVSKAEPLGEPPSPSKAPSARCGRLNVRDNRKEAIATSMTLDFVSLASCDRGMVQECDDGHSHVEALKRKRDVSLACHETVDDQRGHMYCRLSTIQASTIRASTKGGSVVPRRTAPSPLSESNSSSEGRSQCASELRGLVPKRIKLLYRKDPARPQSSRGSDTSPGASECLASVPSWPTPGAGSSSLGPRSTAGSANMWAPGSFPPPRLLSSRSVAHGSECGQGHSRMGSTHGSISESLSSFTGQAAMRCGTPPGAPDAFEAHGVLVKCPAPKRLPVLAPSGLSAPPAPPKARRSL